MLDVKRLAEAVRRVLAPKLKNLLDSGDLGGGSDLDEARDALARLWQEVQGRPTALGAAAEAQEDPDDDDTQAVWRVQIRKILAADDQLADALAAVLKEAPPSAEAGGARAEGQTAVAAERVAVGHDVKGDVIVIDASAGAQAEPILRALGRGKEPADLAKPTAEYLELLVQQYRYLDFRGMGVSDRVSLRMPLLEMFVPLRARVEMPEGEAWERGLKLAGRRPTEEEEASMGRRLSEPQPVLELLARHDGLIVLGDPGAGKTTFLKFLALLLATGQGEMLGLGDRLPVLVPLSAYATALEEQDVPLERFLHGYYANRGLPLPMEALLLEALRQGRALVLFDGLDEVRSEGRRRLVVDRVVELFCARRKAGNKFVLSSRIVGYKEVRPTTEGLGECTLVDFEEEEIGAFLEKWTEALERAAHGDSRFSRERAADERRELLSAVEHNPGVRQLASNPLLLTILALMKRQGVELPERRAELYENYVSTLLRSWNLARGLDRRSAQSSPVPDVAATLRILEPLALWMHETSPGVGLVKEQALRRELVSIFRQAEAEDAEPPGAETMARDFLRDLREHAGLLIERGQRRYGFLHLTFQEYLAGRALAQREDDLSALRTAIRKHVDDPPWHEVLLLSIGFLALVQQREKATSRILDQILSESPGPPGAASAFVGQALVDVGRSGVSSTCLSSGVDSLLSTLDSEAVEPVARAQAGHLLSRLGDPRRNVMAVDGMEFCLVPAGPFWMGSEYSDDQAFDREKPCHELDLPYPFFLGRYPVSVAQFVEYLENTGEPPGAPDALLDPRNHPVRWVNWCEGRKFSHWLTSRWREMGLLPEPWAARLPTEAEWEKACRGGAFVPSAPAITGISDGVFSGLDVVDLERNPLAKRRYPWGDDFASSLGNSFETGIHSPSTLGGFSKGRSVYGCEEMSGNLWEWTLSAWRKESDEDSYRYPYDPEDGRENLQNEQFLRVLRGGSFDNDHGRVRCAVRLRSAPEGRFDSIGFRVGLFPFSLDSEISDL